MRARVRFVARVQKCSVRDAIDGERLSRDVRAAGKYT